MNREGDAGEPKRCRRLRTDTPACKENDESQAMRRYVAGTLAGSSGSLPRFASSPS
jgi:hypothetical protein